MDFLSVWATKNKKEQKNCYLVLDFFKICSQSYTVACLYCYKTGSYKWADRMCFLASAVLACRIQAEILYSSARPIGLDPMCSCHDFALTKKPVLQLNKGKYITVAACDILPKHIQPIASPFLRTNCTAKQATV